MARALLACALGLLGLLVLFPILLPAEETERIVTDDWRRVLLVGESGAVYLGPHPNLTSLLVAAPYDTAGTEEFAPALDTYSSGGYRLLTANAGSSGTRAAVFKALVEHGSRRPGFARRVLAVPGKDLLMALDALAEAGVSSLYNALVVLRPGDAWSDRAAIVRHTRALPVELELLWVDSGTSREGYFARLLWESLGNRPGHSISSAALTQPLGSAMPALAAPAVLDRIMILRLQIEWSPAATVFGSGCTIDNARRLRIRLQEAETSARADVNFCPLFMRFSGDYLWRARDVSGSVCVYGTPDRLDRLYCSY